MLQTIPRLFGINVVFDSFTSCVANAPEKLSKTLEMSFAEIFSKLRMFAQKFKGIVTFKQLKRFTDRHCWKQLDKVDKKMYVVESDVKFIDVKAMTLGNFAKEFFAIDVNTKKLERIPSIFKLPDKLESVLSKAMVKRLQIHFFPFSRLARKDHTNSIHLFHKGNINPLSCLEIQNFKFKEDGNSLLGLKAEVFLPFM